MEEVDIPIREGLGARLPQGTLLLITLGHVCAAVAGIGFEHWWKLSQGPERTDMQLPQGSCTR